MYITWENTIKIYGIFFGQRGQELTQDLILKKLQGIVEFHQRRSLTMRGKALIINVLFLTRLWYAGAIIIFERTFIDKVQRISFKFLWRTTEWLARLTVIGPVDQGGLGVFDLKTRLAALRIMHLKHFAFGSEVSWHTVAAFWIGLSLRQFNSRYASNMIRHAESERPRFYEQALKDFHRFLELTNGSFNGSLTRRTAPAVTMATPHV